jgi:hypothetical protein
MGGRKRRFCSSVPCTISVGPRAMPLPVAAGAPEVAHLLVVDELAGGAGAGAAVLRGQASVSQPFSARRRANAWLCTSHSRSSSASSAYGVHSRSRNARTSARNRSSSGEKRKSIAAPLAAAASVDPQPARAAGWWDIGVHAPERFSPHLAKAGWNVAGGHVAPWATIAFPCPPILPARRRSDQGRGCCRERALIPASPGPLCPVAPHSSLVGTASARDHTSRNVRTQMVKCSGR